MSPRRRGRFAALVLAVLCVFAASGISHAAARKLLRMEFSADGGSALVKVPAGYESVALQRFQRQGGWKTVATRKTRPGIARFKLPKAGGNVRWRAVGRFQSADAPRGKFPAAFYQGKSSFGPLKTHAGLAAFRGLTVTGGDAGEQTPDALPEEADIWRIDGDTVYFFNQLRGLQVLDLSVPSDPRLTASLRLPAVGEDLYLLPGSGRARRLALLTQRYGDDGAASTRIQIVRVDGGEIRLTHRQDVPGCLTDSRLVGDRLILATTEWGGGLIADDGTWTEGASVSRLTQWVLAPGEPPKAGESFEFAGGWPLIAAGADWMAVALTPDNEWNHSEVSVFGLDSAGLVKLTPAPIRCAGVIADKFKLQWRDHVLTTISEKFRRDGSPLTVLENFRVWGAGVMHAAVIEGRIGRLALAEGESLHATRFAGNKAYIVTFEQTDPLWVVDLSDPRKPAVAGSLEVPGWSSHLEPLGDLLFSVGWEGGTVAASLFDVADPTKPALLRRLNLGKPGSYSEAAWDEQALKVLPDAGLAMIPLTSYDDAGNPVSSVRLLDLENRDLALRGAIPHAFDARRSDLIGATVVSLSQRVLVAADITHRDHPMVLSEVALAWPVDRALDAGRFLLHIEEGVSFGLGRATARVTPANDPEAVLSETDLGNGRVRGADLRDGKLYVLRELQPEYQVFDRSDSTGGPGARLALDVYDAGALPVLRRTGTCQLRHHPDLRVAGEGLLWPRSNRPAVVLDAGSSFWFGWGLAKTSAAATLAEAASLKSKPGGFVAIDRFPYWREPRAPRLVVFDVADPANPAAAEPVPIGTARTIPNGLYQAGGGLVVIGAADWKDESGGGIVPAGHAIQSAYVAEVPEAGLPVVRPVIDLPGELFAVTELDRAGFLAFTRSPSAGDGQEIQVSACDGYDAYQINRIAAGDSPAATAGGRRLFLSAADGVRRFRLGDDGGFSAERDLAVGWKPGSLRWTDGLLLGARWNRLCAAGPQAEAADTWRFPTWGLRLERVGLASDGDLLVPFGEYGAERLDR